MALFSGVHRLTGLYIFNIWIWRLRVSETERRLFTVFVWVAEDGAWSISILITPSPVRPPHHSSSQWQHFTSIHLVCHSTVQHSYTALKQLCEYLDCSEQMLIIHTGTGLETSWCTCWLFRHRHWNIMVYMLVVQTQTLKHHGVHAGCSDIGTETPRHTCWLFRQTQTLKHHSCACGFCSDRCRNWNIMVYMLIIQTDTLKHHDVQVDCSDKHWNIMVYMLIVGVQDEWSDT